MRFPNAYAGVKKIFTAQILKIIASFSMAIGGIAILVFTATLQAVAGEAGADDIIVGSGLISAIFLVASAVLGVIAYILNIVGLRQAGKDEDSFDSGFVTAIFALLISIATGIFSALNVGGGIADNIAQTVQYICEIFIIFCVVNGISNLAVRLGNEKMAETGRKLFTIICIMVILSALSNLIPVFFGKLPFFNALSGGLSIVAGILSIVGYIIYLVFLGRAKKMLREG